MALFAPFLGKSVVIKEHPYAKKFRDAPEPWWFELYGIFDPMRLAAEEKKFHDSGYCIETPEPFVDDEAEDEDCHVRDEQSFVASAKYLVPLSGPSPYAGKSEMEIWNARFEEELGIEHSAMSSVASSIWP
ncbi:unnamed protein product [Cuscuta epithymum]|uniref:Uncharacterized protein n=1 Tax=Cuscuta epithymum TaxID=186058 RepID=A0AAV0FGS3_9ASTE|nr:unnamed protein product [Cuscuta epithymum]